MKKLKLEIARPEEASAISAMRTAVAEHLTAKYGHGHWSSGVSEKRVLFNMRNGRTYVVRKRNIPIATLTLVTKKPWAIDRSYFTPVKRPLYLIGMDVAVNEQRKGVGRFCIEEAERICRELRADAIFLDAYDAPAGAGEFYAKCGFREVKRAAYKGVPLIYLEMLLQ